MWEKKATHGFPKAELREISRPLLDTLKDGIICFQQQYQNHWWNDFLPRLRVFSVSETHDSLLMWSHYAKDHTGVVFEFRVMPEADNPLCAAGPVKYCRQPPSFLSESEWLENIIHGRDLDMSALYFRYAYAKSDIWSYEKEWRVWDLLDDAKGVLCSPYELRPNEIATVYFGCKVDPAMKATVLRLLSSHPTATAFQARKSPDQFKLYFDPA